MGRQPARRATIGTIAVVALVATLAGCGGDAHRGSDDSQLAPRRLRRLSSREYNQVVRDLLGDTTRPADRFVIDSYPNGYDNGAVKLAVQSDQVVDYQAAAEDLAARAVANNLPLLLGGCDPGVSGSDACIDAFLGGFATRAYRRPLTATEAQRLRDVIAATLTATDLPKAIEAALQVVLQSPQFLYREELGPPDAVAAAGGLVRLTDYEVASQLSFLLTGSIPDDTLWQAVQSGSFHQRADHRREALRLLATPQAHEALRGFLHQWLTTDRLARTSKDPSFYPDFSRALAASMRDELDGLYDSVLFDGTGSLHELFVRGVLVTPGFLTVHADSDGSGPIARGVFVLQSILCTPPPPRPANVPPVTSASDPAAKTMSTRERFAAHVADPYCAGCHRQIDGVGFSFEGFDGIGRARTVDNGEPVDTSGELVGTQKIDGALRDADELSARLSLAQQVADCFARQTYRYAMGDIEPAGDDLRWLASRFTMQSRVTDLVLALVEDPRFVTRAFERDDEGAR